MWCQFGVIAELNGCTQEILEGGQVDFVVMSINYEETVADNDIYEVNLRNTMHVVNICGVV